MAALTLTKFWCCQSAQILAYLEFWWAWQFCRDQWLSGETESLAKSASFPKIAFQLRGTHDFSQLVLFSLKNETRLWSWSNAMQSWRPNFVFSYGGLVFYCVYTKHSFFNHSVVLGHLGCFWLLWIASVNIGVQIAFFFFFFFSGF